MVGQQVMEDIVSHLTFGSNEHNDYLQRKLAHYNAWLLDPKREVGSGPYPGFPEDIARTKGVAKLKADIAAKAETKAKFKTMWTPTAPKKERAKRAKRTDGPTKQDRAVEIYRELNGDKATVISAIQERLGMSVAGATTYFYNAKKLA